MAVYKTDSSFNHFTKTFSSCPFLVRRLQRIDSSNLINDTLPKISESNDKNNTKIKDVKYGSDS